MSETPDSEYQKYLSELTDHDLIDLVTCQDEPTDFEIELVGRLSELLY